MRNRFKSVLSFVMVCALVSVAGLSGSAGAADWWENVKVKGDFRYRHEMISKEDVDARHRNRIRARFGIFAKANENTNIGIQLATGSDDPGSTNQTLDGSFTTKNISLDLAYFEYKPSKLNGLKVVGGKFKNQFFKPGKSELIWDGDLNPEGGVVAYNHKSDNFGLTLIGSGLWIDEDSKKEDVSLLAGQGIVSLGFNEKNSSVVVGGSYFKYNNMLGHKTLYEVNDAKGNSIDKIYDTTFYVTHNDDTAIGGIGEYHTYQNDYELMELFLELNHKFDKTPITVMFDYVTNSAADSLNTGWLVGLRIGKAKKAGSWEFRYNYREVEKDAVVGMFSDSDFGGGGTNSKGHEIGGAYQLLKNTAFKLTYFTNEIGIDQDETEDYSRLQADLQLKF